MDITLFEKSKQLVLEREALAQGGIGTLGEKTVHSTLKQYLSDDLSCQEIKIGSYFADVCINGHIFEIQTRQFGKLRDKLAYFLPEHKVTVVYPVSSVNYLRWVDTASGEVSAPKKSPRRGNPLNVFAELYRIRSFLSHPNFSLKIVLLETEEYRILDGYGKDKKKRATKCDRLPLSLIAEYNIDIPADYMMLLPPDLPDVFTATEFAKSARISPDVARTALLLLSELSVVSRTGKQQNAYLYEIGSL